jgi:multidrug efflux pump
VAGRDPLTRLLDFTLGWFFRGFNRALSAGTSAYTWGVGKLLRFRLLVLLIYGGLLLLTFSVLTRAPTGFVPQQDMGRLLVTIQLPDSASQERTREVMALAEKIARQTPGVKYTMGPAGTSLALGVNSSNFATLFVVLDPFEERRSPERSADAIMARLRKEYARGIRDGQLTVAGMPPVPGISLMGGFKLMVEDRAGLGLANLQQQADALIRKMKGRPGLVGVSTQFRSDTPQLYLDIDRDKVKSMGVSLDDLNQTLQIYLGSLYVNSFNQYGRYWQVVLQAEGNYRTRVEDIRLLQVRNDQGQMVPLSALVNVREVGGPVFVQRYNLYPAAAVTGGLRPGVSTGEAIAEIEALARESLSPTMATEWTEMMFIQIRAGNTALGVFALAVVFVFLALAALYESWAQPLAVILVVPLCLLCSVIGVLLAHRSVDIFVQIGLVVLVGLACKNSILIVEFAKQQRQEGKSRSEATLEATRLRLRPILMTSFAFILGVVPLVLATGAGSEMRRSLGTAVFSGMLGVTFFGIFLTPVFFHVIDWLGEMGLVRGTTGRWVGSSVLGALAGLAFGLLLAHVGIARSPWAPIGGSVLGLLGALTVLALRSRARSVKRGSATHGETGGRV